MGHYWYLCVVLPVITIYSAHAMELVCQIHLQLAVGPKLAAELRHCTMFIAYSVSFDVTKSTVLSNEELAGIEALKRSNSSADVLLTIALPFNTTMLSTHVTLCERIAIVLRDNSLDGVDLDLDIAQLDHYEQIRYAQFLRRLRALLRDKYKISTTIGCATLSNPLPRALNEHLDMVTVVGADVSDDPLSNASAEFVPRTYSTEVIQRLIQDGISPRKLVLSLLTIGIVFNPGNYRVTRSLQQSRVGVLSYGQVCELMHELNAKCGGSVTVQRPGCSIFRGKGVVVYDSEASVASRTKQVMDMGLNGILMLPNYDDMDNLCDKGPFPLLRSLRTAMATHKPPPAGNLLLCSNGYRSGGIEGGGRYYKCYSERFRENCCEAGSVFSDLLKICIGANVPPIVLKAGSNIAGADNVEPSSAKPALVPASLEPSSTVVPAFVTTQPPGEPLEQDFNYFLSAFQNALSYLDGTIQRALALVLRLEYLQQTMTNGTTEENRQSEEKKVERRDDIRGETNVPEPLLVPFVADSFLPFSNDADSAVADEEELEIIYDSEESGEQTAAPFLLPFW